MIVVLILLIALAVLGPLFGADSRDGRDWTRGPFLPARRHVADPGDDHSPEPEECLHELEPAEHSPAYC